jgi:hypothetical protein
VTVAQTLQELNECAVAACEPLPRDMVLLQFMTRLMASGTALCIFFTNDVKVRACVGCGHRESLITFLVCRLYAPTRSLV